MKAFPSRSSADVNDMAALLNPCRVPGQGGAEILHLQKAVCKGVQPFQIIHIF